MKNIWLIESPSSLYPVGPLIQGSMALRLVASIKSFRLLVKISKPIELPHLVLVNSSDFQEELMLELKAYSPESKYIRVYSKHDPVRSNQEDGVSASELPFLFKSMLRDEVKSSLKINFEAMELLVPDLDAPINISQKEAHIVKTFIDHGGKVVSRESLQEIVWQGMKVSRSTLDSHISRLRKKLEYSPIEIESVYGGGYRLKQN